MADYTLAGDAPVAFTMTGLALTSLLAARAMLTAVVAFTMTAGSAALDAGGGAVLGAAATAASILMTGLAAKPRAGLTSYRNIYIPFHARRRKVVL